MLVVPSLFADAVLLQTAIERAHLEAVRRGDLRRTRLLAEALQHATRLRAILGDLDAKVEQP